MAIMTNELSSPVIAILNEAKAKALDVIKAKKLEILDIDRAIAALNGVQHIASKTDQKASIYAQVSQIRHSMPVGDAIVKAVEAGNKGPNAIWHYLAKELGVHTTLGSIRSRLSPLKAEGRIGHDGLGWVPIKKEKPESATLSDLLS